MTANGLRAESTKMIATAEWALSRRLGALLAARAIDKAAADAKLASSASRPTGVGIARIKVALSGVVGRRGGATRSKFPADHILVISVVLEQRLMFLTAHKLPNGAVGVRESVVKESDQGSFGGHSFFRALDGGLASHDPIILTLQILLVDLPTGLDD